MNMYSLQLFIFLISAVYVAAERPDLQIIGGHDTDISLHPWQASIRAIYANNDHICGASIISNSWIVTAAHCIFMYTTHDVAVQIGSTYRSSGGQLLDHVYSIIEHPDWNFGGVDNDIALLKLSKPFTNPNAASIHLPAQDEELADGTVFSVTGWGRLGEGGEDAEVLQEVFIPLVSRQKCQNAYRDGEITDNMFCLGDFVNEKDSCHGDAGSPAVVGNKLFGIVSWGESCGHPQHPGVYVKVSNYIEWIKNVTEIS